ncbi:Transporter major facilitator family protein [Trichostrongylus colubriformis]|uniref:Transporter major facilitator family protein n=1 Tax=Trichostrongylus colubriformis TaxID=6319 RepID=A0AAN8FPX6_TRICO
MARGSPSTTTQPLSQSSKSKKEQSKLPTWNLAKAALLVSIGGGFNFGYQLLITNPAQAAFIEFLNDSYAKTHGVYESRETLVFIWGVIVSTFFWGATVGALLIQTVADRLGRRNGIIGSFLVQIIAVALEILSSFTNSYILYSLARILLGAAIGVSIGIGPMFIIECSPLACRGMISMATGILLQVGLVVGSITAMPEIWGTVDSWWLIYGLELLLTISVTVLLLFLPESPSYLLTQDKEQAAEESILFYHGVSERETEPLIESLKKGTEGEKPLGLFEIFTDKKWLCGFLVGIAIMNGTMMCGVAAVNAFAFDILLSVGLKATHASLGNLAICIMAVIGVLASGQLVERMGRRPLLLLTFGGLGLVNVLISGFMYMFQLNKEQWIGWCVVLSICVFNLSFAIGPGPLCFFVPGELVSQKAVAATYTWLNIVMNGSRTLLLIIYFPIQNALGGPLCYFILFFPPCVVTFAICYFYLPETKGLTPEQARHAMHRLRGFCGKGLKDETDGKEMSSY